MAFIETPRGTAPTSGREPWDVIVAGGGVSGCMAAIASARMGARTLLIERYGFLGGSLSNAGVGPMMTFHAGKRQVVGGLAQELVERLMLLQASPGPIEDTTGYASSITPFDPETLKFVLDEMACESGVEVLFHARLAQACCEGRRVASIRVAAKDGEQTLEARCFVDATGDGDLAWLSGAAVEQGRQEDGLCQPMTTNMRIGPVDIAELKAEIRRHPQNFNIRDLSALDRSPRLSVAGFYREFESAKAAGLLSTQREDVLLFETNQPGEMIANTTRVIHLNPVDPWELSKAEREGRRQAHELMRFFKTQCAGFEKAVLLSTGVQIGVRESRRIVGDWMLTQEDLLASRDFEDAVALGGYPIDIHNPDGAHTKTIRLKPGQYYRIPLRCLIARDRDNLLAAGRCISATHEACAAIRVSPIAMAVGQAAGTAAALSVRAGCDPRELDPAQVRAALLRQGAILCSEENDREGKNDDCQS